MQPDVLAWRIEIQDMSGICAAASAPKARWIAVRNYWEAGYGRKGLWPRPVAVREPRFDNHPTLVRDPHRIYNEQYLRGRYE